jgi:hypothetical protein
MSCIVDSAAIYIMVVTFRNTIGPLHRSSPFIWWLRRQAIQMEHGPYTAERTQKQTILWDVYDENLSGLFSQDLISQYSTKQYI